MPFGRAQRPGRSGSRGEKKGDLFYLLIRNPKTAAAAPNPARIPANGTGVFACGVSFAIGFTVGTSGAGVTAGVGVGVGVGVDVSVSQVEEPCGELLLFTGVSYVSANGEKPVGLKVNVYIPFSGPLKLSGLMCSPSQASSV